MSDFGDPTVCHIDFEGVRQGVSVLVASASGEG